jgi:hypothetical protein
MQRRSSRPPRRPPRRRGRNLKFTGLTQNLGQLFKALIGIVSRIAGSNCEFWVNPVNFAFGVAVVIVELEEDCLN